MKVVLFVVWSNLALLFGYWLCKRQHNDDGSSE